MSYSLNIATHVRVVLVATTHPGNIGATARAMKTMGLNQLYLVRPKFFPHVEATARASGADDILANAVVVDSLHDALCNCKLVIGTSARQRDLPLVLLSPREAAKLVVEETTKETAESNTAENNAKYNVALVFGRESNGLHNDELLQCNYHVYIPANPEFSSLNIAAAVQIIAYEVMMAATQSTTAFSLAPTSSTPHDEIASFAEVQAFYAHLEKLLIELGFLRPQKSKRVMVRVQRLFNRVRLEHLEVGFLRGILTTIEGKLQIEQALDT